MNKELIKAISELEEDKALQMVREILDKGEDPLSILEDCQAATGIVGERFQKGEYYLPELIMSGEVLKHISDIVKPKLQAQQKTPGGSEGKKGKIVLGTVRGDIHNIGKDIVGFMLEANGYEVHDLGVDVPEEKFVQAIQEVNPQVVGLSGLLTSIFDSMRSTVEAIKKAGLRERVKVMIGGGQLDERVKDYVGADGFGTVAITALTLAKQWIPEK
jgi:methanogenic corrinoid protein MtbC1